MSSNVARTPAADPLGSAVAPGAALSLERKLAPAHTALLVVDVQNAWCDPRGVRFMQRPPEVLAGLQTHLNVLLGAAREAGALIVFVRMAHDPATLSPAYAEQLRRQGTLGSIVTGSWDAELWADIRPQPGKLREVEVTKHRYSAFNRTDLDVVLKSNGIRTLVVSGVATAGCVFATALDGFLNDYYTIIAGDAVADRDQTAHAVFLQRFRDTCGEVLTATEIAALWAAA